MGGMKSDLLVYVIMGNNFQVNYSNRRERKTPGSEFKYEQTDFNKNKDSFFLI